MKRIEVFRVLREDLAIKFLGFFKPPRLMMRKPIIDLSKMRGVHGRSLAKPECACDGAAITA